VPFLFGNASLLPIREAYEWKRFLTILEKCFAIIPQSFLLPIREAYEWKHSAWDWASAQSSYGLLPIREAYEWKPADKSAFLVKTLTTFNFLLPIREAYEWKQYREYHI